MAALQVLNVALPAAKGITTLGRFGAGLLASEAAEERLAAELGTGCFVAGTPVLMADGRQVAIERSGRATWYSAATSGSL